MFPLRKNETSTIKVRRLTPLSPLFQTLLCLALVTLNCQCSPLFAQRGEGPTRVVAGNVIKAKRSSLQSFVGTIQASRITTVGSAVDGRVIKVDFDAGDPVGQSKSPGNTPSTFVGQPLVELRTNMLDIEIKTAEMQEELAQQAYDELKLAMPQNIELAKSNLLGAQSQLDYANANYQRLRKLQKNSGAISTLEVELARSQFGAAQQTVIGAKAEERRLSITRELQLTQSQLRVDAARQETLRLKDLKAQYTIRAPFEGVVTQKLTEVGEWVTRGSPIVEIVQLDPIELIVNIPQEYSGRLQESIEQASENNKPLNVKIEVNGIDQTFTGKLIRVIPQADLRSRSFPVRIRIANPPVATTQLQSKESDESGSGQNNKSSNLDPSSISRPNLNQSKTYRLNPGMLGRASLLVGRETEMVLVKKDALVLGTGGNKIFKVVQSGDKATAVPVIVETGTEVGSWVQVVGNIAENDTVVILGNERLRPGAEIIVAETKTEKLDE